MQDPMKLCACMHSRKSGDWAGALSLLSEGAAQDKYMSMTVAIVLLRGVRPKVAVGKELLSVLACAAAPTNSHCHQVSLYSSPERSFYRSPRRHPAQAPGVAFPETPSTAHCEPCFRPFAFLESDGSVTFLNSGTSVLQPKRKAERQWR